MKSRISTILLLLALIVGLSLLLYPSLADYWNQYHASYAISDYVETLEGMDEETLKAAWDTAHSYNDSLKTRSNHFLLSAEQQEAYKEALNLGSTGIMGYIDIPNIDVTLPIYHGTDEGILQVAIGHLDWSYLPIGGESTHCVVSGHRGLPSARLFTDLDELEMGDTFTFEILDESFVYEVDQILTVLPSDMDSMIPVNGEDYVTLVTCTPYGVNSHRLLVRGHRIEGPEKVSTLRVTSEAVQIEPFIIAPMLAIPILVILLIGLLISDLVRKPKTAKNDPTEETYNEETF